MSKYCIKKISEDWNWQLLVDPFGLRDIRSCSSFLMCIFKINCNVKLFRINMLFSFI